MYTTIIFGLALLCSIFYVFAWLNIAVTATITKKSQDGGSFMVVMIFGAIVFWMWFYYLTH